MLGYNVSEGSWATTEWKPQWTSLGLSHSWANSGEGVGPLKANLPPLPPASTPAPRHTHSEHPQETGFLSTCGASVCVALTQSAGLCLEALAQGPCAEEPQVKLLRGEGLVSMGGAETRALWG